MILIKKANMQDARLVAKNLRATDKRELKRAGKEDYEQAVLDSVRVSPFAFAALEGKTPLCVFGMLPDGVLSIRARVWMLGTAAINENKKEFVKACRTVIDGMLDIYPILYNIVDANYPQAIRLLEFLGASFGEKITLDTGAPFLFFEIRRDNHVYRK